MTDSVESALTRLAAAAEQASEVAAAPGTAIVPTGAAEAELVKAGMVQKRAELLRRKQEVEQAAAEAKELISAQVKALEAQLNEKMKLLEPALKELRKLGDGVHALNVYLGRDEEITQLADGDRAPADTVITVRQLVLSMDEESLVAADRDGMDFRDIDKFSDWLLRDPAHLEQLLPEPKGVVALVPHRQEKNYRDPWTQMQADRENKQTYWLVRNGEGLWLTSTDFIVGKHTVPTPREFTDMFVVKDRFGGPDTPLVPGSAEWMKAEEYADARTRHYMKVALLLQGLLDRTVVFHPHGEVSFLNQVDYDSGRVKVILDDENVLGDGRLPYRAWVDKKRSVMHEGMRVIGAFASRMTLWDNKKSYSEAQVRPQGARPDSQRPYNVRASSHSYFDWEFSFDREDEIFDKNTWEYRKPKTKATGYLSNDEAWWLPLETVTVDELEYYLNSRSQRHDYLDMIPTLRAALAVKRAEAEAEAPFRAALVDALRREVGEEFTEADADELIVWFKTANKHHRALTDDDSKAARIILTEARRRARGGDKDARLLSTLASAHPDALVIARRSSDIIVVEAQPRNLPSVPMNVFVRTHTYTLSGAHKQTHEWVTLKRAQTARWTLLSTSEEWDGWEFNVNPRLHYTDDELCTVIEKVWAERPGAFIVRLSSAGKGWTCAHGDYYAMSASGVVETGAVRVDRVNGEAAVSVRRGHSVDTRYDEPHWEVRWSGEVHPEWDIWTDDALLTQAGNAWRAATDEAKRARQSRDAAVAVTLRIEQQWEADAEEKLRERFVEDFGDASLWEGHRKGIKLPSYPFRWNQDRPFRDAAIALMQGGRDLTGMTVQEVLGAAGTPVTSVPEEILGYTL